MQQYKWPIYFFVAVAFWNLVGAGLFGFMINPPIALYYMQGLNTTPVHGHAALFGVYGMLGLGLMLFTLRALNPGGVWRDGLIKFSFWSTNVGLMAMVGAEPAADRPGADVGVGRDRLLVRAEPGVHPAADAAGLPLAARARRHAVHRRHRRRSSCSSRGWRSGISYEKEKHRQPLA